MPPAAHGLHISGRLTMARRPSWSRCVP